MDKRYASVEEIATLIVGESNGLVRKSFTGLATIESVTSQGVYIVIDGETTPSKKGRKRLNSYTPKVGDRVLVFRDIVIGKII